MLRFCALAVVLAACGSAVASFDLILATQTYNLPTGPSHTVITRWDPVNQLALGYFVAPGIISSSRLMLDPARPGVVTGATAISGGLRFNSFEYSTGNYLGQSTLSLSGVTLTSIDPLSGGSFFITGLSSGSPFARIISSTGAIIRSYVLPSGTLGVVDAFLGSDGVAHVLTRQAGTTSNDRYTLTSHASGSSAIAASVTLSDNTTLASTNIVRQGNVLAIGTNTFALRNVVTISGTTLGTPTLPGGFTTVTRRVLGGHDNMLHGIGFESATTRTFISTGLIDTLSGNTYFYSTSAAYGDVFDAVVVVAPEPGTMIALGAGLAMILRRKRTRK